MFRPPWTAVFALFAGCSDPGSGTVAPLAQPTGPGGPPPPPQPPPSGAFAPAVPSGIPAHIGVSGDVLWAFSRKDQAALDRMSTPAGRAEVAQIAFADADWRMQAAMTWAAGPTRFTQCRQAGDVLYCKFLQLASGEVAVLVHRLVGNYPQFERFARMSVTEWEATGAVVL